MPEENKNVVYIFEPKEDVSLLLIARLLKNLYLNAGMGFPKRVYDSFPEEDKKHFKEIERSSIIKPR